MSCDTNEANEWKKISKVSFSQISPEALVVRIRKFSTEVKAEDLPQVSSDFKSIIPRPVDIQAVEQRRSNMADSTKKAHKSSKNTKKQKQRSLRSQPENNPDSPPCLKHAAENISRKAADLPAEKINLCSNCSKSMLSYIFVVQDFLDSLAKEIIGDKPSHCLQCAREEVRKSIRESSESLSHDGEASAHAARNKYSQTDSSIKQTTGKETLKTDSHRGEPEKNFQHGSRFVAPASQQHPQFVCNGSSPDIYSPESKDTSSVDDGQRYVNTKHDSTPHVPHKVADSAQKNAQRVFFPDSAPADVQREVLSGSLSRQQLGSPANTSSEQASPTQRLFQEPANTSSEQASPTQRPFQEQSDSQNPNRCQSGSTTYSNFERQIEDKSSPTNIDSHNFHPHPEVEHSSKTVFRPPMERTQPRYDVMPTSHPGHNDPNNNLPIQHSPSLYHDSLDGIVSTLSTVEREVYDNARNIAGWESITETELSSHTIASEAFVTSCRNNAEAIGCLVVGTSLLLCRTSRTLCVLVSDGVSTAFRNALSTVFQVVQNVRSLDTLGTTKLALLQQPELGITFEKLNVWRLTQFSKCIYLNPDTLVIQNCDELFNHKELSAVPDIGWPDCFNSGVFVYTPSTHTFWALMEHADKQGSYDGGDQGLLNSYFHSWSSDIGKKLSFIYNLMANVSYTYTPAFKQFGRNVKIVQFHGSFKPWHVKFFTKSGQVSPSSPVHPTYVQFVHIWLNIFRISVLRLMSQEIQSYAASQETICAVEILRFFPLPSESEAEFFLTPPSVRLRRAEQKLERPSSLPISAAPRRKSAEYSRHISSDDQPPSSESSKIKDSQPSETPKEDEQDVGNTPVATAIEPEKESSVKSESLSEVDDVFPDSEVAKKTKVRDENSLPGAEIGDYQGMQAWEQGRMDYEGTDSSDNVLKRLQFLMSRSNK